MAETTEQIEHAGQASEDQFRADVQAQEEKGKAEPAVTTEPTATQVVTQSTIAAAPPTAEPAATIPPPASAPQRTWQQDVKEISTAALLAEKGVDPKIISLITTYEGGGNMTDWLSAATTNYDSMGDESMLREQVKRQYPGVTDAQEMEDLYQDALEKYKLTAEDPEDPEEAKRVRRDKIKLREAVRSTREDLKKEQSDRLLPSRQIDPKVAAQQAQEKAQKEQYVSDHPATKQLLDKKTVRIGEGDWAFDFPVPDAEQIAAWLKTDPDSVVDADGKPDVAKRMKAGLQASYGDAMIKQAYENGKVIGAKGLAAELTNPGELGAVSTTDGEADAYEAMAKRGTVRQGQSSAPK